MQEYVAPEQWKTLNALEGFGQNRMDTTESLAGRTFAIDFADGPAAEYAFEDGTRMRWTDPPLGDARDQPYEAREVAPELFLVMFHDRVRRERACTLILDLERGIATLVVSVVVGDDAAGRHVDEEVRHGWLADGHRSDRHQRTDEMVGHRVQYIYSATDAYEHVYLNPSAYAWHCLEGQEKGECDCDPMIAFKLRERVYLAAWRESVVPCDGVVVIDWVQMRSNGRIFGWDTAARDFNSISMGARAVALNHTTYAPLQ